MEYFKKEHNIKLYTDPVIRREALLKGIDGDFDAFLQGTRMGLDDLRRSKAQYEVALHSNKFSNFHAVYLPLMAQLPFCFASPFAPEFTFDGRLILPDLEEQWDTVAAFAGTLGQSNFFLLCGFESDWHDILAFIGSAGYIPEQFGGSAALHIALEYAENTFFRTSWIESLDAATRFDMLSRFLSGTPGDPDTRKAQILSCKDIVGISRAEVMLLENSLTE